MKGLAIAGLLLGALGLLAATMLARTPRASVPVAAVQRAPTLERAGTLASDPALPTEHDLVTPARSERREPRVVERGDEPWTPAPQQVAQATPEELRAFRAFIGESLGQVRTIEASGKLNRIEARRSNLELFIAQWERELQLSASQSDRMRSCELERLDREAEYVRLWRTGADEQFLSDLKARDGARHLAQLGTFLSAEQLATYRAQLP